MAGPSKMQQRLNNKNRRPLGESVYYKGATGMKAVPHFSEERDRDAYNPEVRNVLYMSRSKVEEYQFQPGDVLISISDIGKYAPQLKHKPAAVLKLNFNAYVDRREREQGLREFNKEDAVAIAKFLKENTDSANRLGNIIVHCNQGEVRSRAVATGIAEFFSIKAYTYSNNGGLVRKFMDQDHDSARTSFYVYKQLDEHFE